MQNNVTLTLLEEILKMSETGAHFSKDEYNRNRYLEIKEKAFQLYEQIPGFKRTIIEPLDRVGYITPKVGVNAIIENENGALLLERRMDDKCWGIPGGWAEPGSTAEENIIREIWEETGLNVEVKKLIDVISRKPTPTYLHTSYHIIFHCVITGGSIQKSHESEEIAWKKPDEITNWHADHKDWLKRIKEMY